MGVYNKIVRARTVRRQIMPHKYNPQLLDCAHTGPWKTPASALRTPTLTTPLTMPATSEAPSQKDATTSAAAEGKRQTAGQASDQPEENSRANITNGYITGPSLPAPPPTSPARERDDAIAEGSAGKRQRAIAERQVLERPATAEQPKGKMRANAITFATKDGKQMETTSNEDTEETDNERILLDPIINDAEGLDLQQVAQGMKKEVQQMRDQSVFTETDGNTMTPEQQANIIESRWVLKQKHDEVRARIVAKGYTEPVTDHDRLFASTPLFCTLAMALVCNWSVCTGDVSVAFQHAAAISYNLVMRPPHEFYNEENRRIMWRLNKAIYGLRSSPKQWQDHIAHILTVTLKPTESNVYRSTS